MTVLVHPRLSAGFRDLPQSTRVCASPAPRFAELSAAPNWNRWGVSLFLHALALSLLVKAAMWLPASPIVSTRHESVTLIAPTLESPKPVSVTAPRVLAQVHQPKLTVVTPKMEAPALKPMPAPEPVKIASKAFAPPELPKPALPKTIKEGLFASNSAPAVQAHAHEVQTGAFGDPNGVAATSSSERKPMLASAGAFDAGSAPAANSTATKRTVVTGSAFAGPASSGSGDRNAKSMVAAISTGAFGDASSAELSSKHARAVEVTPVEILYKPKPAYTAEARQLHIQGEVLLDVMFTASGSTRVLRVVRGLGHGLDEAAEIAGQNIRFQPAKRDGRPYDSDAVVHILFQLAD
ncbi:MAG: TonB family protein [Acidobacteria bacterium]|nr:TonB family protein [Acidobacteriota bacterium]